jgi:hypothetical protein
MSGIINKVKDALHGDKHQDETTSSTTHHTGNNSNLTDASKGGYGSAQGGYAQGTAHGSGPTFNEDGTKTGHTGSSGLGTSTQGGGLTGTHHTNTNTGYGSETGGYIQGTAHGSGPAHTTHGTVTGGGLTGTHHQNTNTGGGSREGEYGPHGNRAANALDPRVDSDRDGSHNTRTTGDYGSSGTHGTHGTSGGFTGSSATRREGEHGPHDSRVANALDPRVDSDRDGSHNTRNATAGGGLTGIQHTSNTSGGGLGSSNAGYGIGNSGTREGEHGPHGSRVANAVDPRVDSDRDGSRRVAGETGSHGVQTGYGVGGAGSNTSGTGGGYGSDNYGTAGEYGSNTREYGSNTREYGSNTHGTSGDFTGSSATRREGEHGPHSSRVANALDPRVDSDRDGSRNAGEVGFGNAAGTHETGLHGTTGGLGGNTRDTYGSSGSAGYGNNEGYSGATATAGPHNSNMLNKLDPRVDSDRDGSRTVGGNNTYQ